VFLFKRLYPGRVSLCPPAPVPVSIRNHYISQTTYARFQCHIDLSVAFFAMLLRAYCFFNSQQFNTVLQSKHSEKENKRRSFTATQIYETQWIIFDTIIKCLRNQINILKMKRNLLYIRNQSVPRCKHFPPRMTYKAKIAVCSEIRTKHSTQSDKDIEFLNIKPGDT
jgi:hypothetical protein